MYIYALKNTIRLGKLVNLIVIYEKYEYLSICLEITYPEYLNRIIF